MKKGFTLIELLAVILILGIIALIAIPTVNKIISEARYGAFKTSNDNIMKSVEQKCQTDIIKGENPVLSYIFDEGKSNVDIDIKGSIPNNGYIILNKDCDAIDYYFNTDKNVYSSSVDVREEYMIRSPYNNDVSIFGTLYPSYRDAIIGVYFVNHMNIPENAIEIVDISSSNNGKIKSWLVPNGESYDLYVGSDGKIYANYNSSSLFKYLKNVVEFDFSNFDTSFVETMYNMFWGTELVKVLDLSSFKMTNVKNINSMFASCYNLTSLNVSTWDTSNITNMLNLFNNCTNLKYADFSKWDTSKVQNMQGVFSDVKSLITLNLSNWNTSNATNMSYLFDGGEFGSGLQNLDLSNFNTSKVNLMLKMFHNNSALTTLNISSWDFDSITDIHDIFLGAVNLKNLVVKDAVAANFLDDFLPDRNGGTPGIINIVGDKTNLDTSLLNSKNWNVI